MEKREKSKIVEIGNRKFVINRFDAFTGSYILYTLMEKMLPMMLESKVPVSKGENLSNVLPATRLSMTREEFKSFQIDCLRVCQEVLPAGNMPVIGANGNFGVMNLENDVSTVLQLTIHALMFNIVDFFKGNDLSSLMTGLPGIKSQN